MISSFLLIWGWSASIVRCDRKGDLPGLKLPTFCNEPLLLSYFKTFCTGLFIAWVLLYFKRRFSSEACSTSFIGTFLNSLESFFFDELCMKCSYLLGKYSSSFSCDFVNVLTPLDWSYLDSLFIFKVDIFCSIWFSENFLLSCLPPDLRPESA